MCANNSVIVNFLPYGFNVKDANQGQLLFTRTIAQGLYKLLVLVIVPYNRKLGTSLYPLCNSKLLLSNNYIFCSMNIFQCSSNSVNGNLGHDRIWYPHNDGIKHILKNLGHCSRPNSLPKTCGVC